MSNQVKYGTVVVECPDPGKLASFYGELLGARVSRDEPDWATVTGDGWRLDFQAAPGYVAPTWPDPASSMQFHLDFDVDDFEATEERALALGATKSDHQPGESFRVYLDPVGHVFCLCLV